MDGIGSDQPSHVLATVTRDGGTVDLTYRNPGTTPVTAFVDVWMLQGGFAGRYTLQAALARD